MPNAAVAGYDDGRTRAGDVVVVVVGEKEEQNGNLVLGGGLMGRASVG